MRREAKRFMNHGDISKYSDMINLPHHVSRTHPHMQVQDRAAQFAPFAALNGHHEAVRETARLTDERIELDEYCKAAIDGKLKAIREQTNLREEPAVSVTYFVQDAKKTGGSYETVTGCVKKIDEYEKFLVLTDGMKIPIEEIIEIYIYLNCK